jgi:hypothetical protein
MLKAAGIQSLTQIPQALQSSPSITGLGQSERFTWAQICPDASWIAALGQTRPQTPHSTQRFSFIECRAFISPEMANTGQLRAQAVQPIQASVI